MLIYLRSGAVLDIVNDAPIGIGWPEGYPTKNDWITTKNEVEQLLGYSIAEWGAFTNPSTKVFWTEIGDARNCTSATPLLIDLLE